MASLSRRSPEPLYLQLRRILVSQLVNHYFDSNGFPSEHELEERYKVSRTTVRLALEELENEGYISRQRGRGTVVIRSKLRGVGHYLVTFFDEMQATGRQPEMSTLTFEVRTAPRRVWEAFEGDSAQEFHVAERVGMSNGEPLLVSTVYIPRRKGLEVTEADLRSHGSIFALFEERLGISIIGASRVIEAVRATKYEADLLSVRTSDPLLLKWTLAYAADGDPIVCINARFRGDRYQYYIPFLSRSADRLVLPNTGLPVLTEGIEKLSTA